MTDSERAAKPRTFAGLDAGLGPARPLSPTDAEWLVEQVVQRALHPEKRLRSRRLSLRALSLAALAVVTSAAAATLVHQKLQQNAATSEPAASAPQRQIKKRASGVSPQQPATEASAQTAPAADVVEPVREAKPLDASTSNAALPPREVTAVDELSAANDLQRKAQ
jgi:cytoskeletal protein RodZ